MYCKKPFLPTVQQTRTQLRHLSRQPISQWTTYCSIGSSFVGRSGLLALNEFRTIPMALAGSDNGLVTQHRVRVWCARTGDFLYEPSHPRLGEIRLHVLEKWTWINGRVDLPTAHTVFHLHFEVAQQPVDDFLCLDELMMGQSLDINCFVRAPQKPDIRHKKSLEDAICHQQGKRLWALLNTAGGRKFDRIIFRLFEARSSFCGPAFSPSKMPLTWSRSYKQTCTSEDDVKE